MSRTVTYSEDLEPQLREAYPAATSIPEAIVMAAQDGLHTRTGACSFLSESQVREIVREELKD